MRYTFDNNYFDDRYQGIPMGGYNKLIDGLLEGIEVRTGVDYLQHREEYHGMAKTIVYTGPIDEYFGYCLGTLEYRGLRFETERLDEENHQGVAVMNYTDRETPWTRIIEHKHFEFGTQPVTYVTKEYPADWKPGEEAYYPVNNERNQALYAKYAELAKKRRMSSLAAAWPNTSIMTWMMSLPARWQWQGIWRVKRKWIAGKDMVGHDGQEHKDSDCCA